MAILIQARSQQANPLEFGATNPSSVPDLLGTASSDSPLQSSGLFDPRLQWVILEGERVMPLLVLYVWLDQEEAAPRPVSRFMIS